MKHLDMAALKRAATSLGVTVHVNNERNYNPISMGREHTITLSKELEYPFVLAHELSHQVTSAMNAPSMTHNHLVTLQELLTGRMNVRRMAVRTEENTADMVAEILTGGTRKEIDALVGYSSAYPPVTGVRSKAYVEWWAAHVVNRILDASIKTPQEAPSEKPNGENPSHRKPVRSLGKRRRVGAPRSQEVASGR